LTVSKALATCGWTVTRYPLMGEDLRTGEMQGRDRAERERLRGRG
jgi:hypothetical protein